MVGNGLEEIPDFKGKDKASKTWAFITRNMWTDYTQRFWPIEDQLFQQSTYENPNIVDTEIADARGRVNQAIDVSVGNQQQALRGYGVVPTQDQRAVNTRTESLNRSASLVDAANRIRDRLLDRNRQIALGSSSVSDKIAQEG